MMNGRFYALYKQATVGKYALSCSGRNHWCDVGVMLNNQAS